jgi:hypothetical protein
MIRPLEGAVHMRTHLRRAPMNGRFARHLRCLAGDKAADVAMLLRDLDGLWVHSCSTEGWGVTVCLLPHPGTRGLGPSGSTRCRPGDAHLYAHAVPGWLSSRVLDRPFRAVEVPCPASLKDPRSRTRSALWEPDGGSLEMPERLARR